MKLGIITHSKQMPVTTRKPPDTMYVAAAKMINATCHSDESGNTHT